MSSENTEKQGFFAYKIFLKRLIHIDIHTFYANFIFPQIVYYLWIIFGTNSILLCKVCVKSQKRAYFIAI